MHVLSETWVMSRSIQAEKSGLEPKPTSLLQPVRWVTGKEIGLREWLRFWRERPLLRSCGLQEEKPDQGGWGECQGRGLVRRASARSPTMILYQASISSRIGSEMASMRSKDRISLCMRSISSGNMTGLEDPSD